METFPCSKKNKLPILFSKRILVFLIFICLSLTFMYNLQIIPALIPFVKATATTEITLRIQEIINQSFFSNDYGNFVTLKYGSQGNVVSLETDTANIANLTSNITKDVISSLCQNDRLSVSIPLGNLTGGAIFTGKGPDIEVKIAVSEKINCKIENEFYESGINQTLHRIVAIIDTEVYALVPMSVQTIEISTKYCIAETVIVGDVPDAYTKINRVDDEILESDIDDIYDFGATLK